MIDIVLLVLKIGILVLLYLFIWQVVRMAVGNVRNPAGAAVAPDVALPEGAGGRVGVVLRSTALMAPLLAASLAADYAHLVRTRNGTS